MEHTSFQDNYNKIPVIISIKGDRRQIDDENDTVEFVTSGSLSFENGVYSLHYAESELTGMDGTQTTVMVENNKVTVERRGFVSSHMVFEQGQKHLSLYETPVGAITVGVNASAVESTLDENGGQLNVDYSIEIDNAFAGYNGFSIVVVNSSANL